jgi:DNA-binding PucR family transcriptional regulator
VTVRDALLVCITSSALRGTAGELAHHLLTALGSDTGWRVGVGRPHSGPGGVLHSYEEARNTLHLADRLGFRTPVLHSADLLVFPVLLRDRAAINDLVLTALGPLAEARGGAGPLLETLDAFFASHGNSAATARRLNISVRAVAYRLDRIQRLTGYSPGEPTQRFTLEAAVLGARLLDWPRQPLEPEPG